MSSSFSSRSKLAGRNSPIDERLYTEVFGEGSVWKVRWNVLFLLVFGLSCRVLRLVEVPHTHTSQLFSGIDECECGPTGVPGEQGKQGNAKSGERGSRQTLHARLPFHPNILLRMAKLGSRTAAEDHCEPLAFAG